MEASGAAQQRCQVKRWRGYVRSTFYAAGPREGLLHESEPFRWRDAEPPPDAGAARAAYDLLVSRLLADGWEPEGQGRLWFETRFVHTGLEHVPAEAVVQAHTADDATRRALTRPRRRAAVRAVTATAIAIGAFGAAALVAGAGSTPSKASARAPSRSPVSSLAMHASRQVEHGRTQPRRAARTVDLRIVGHDNGSWLEVRRTSASGPILYSGVLASGTTLHFRAPRLWARMGAAGNLDVTVDGKPVPLQGTYDKLFLPSRSS